MPAAAGGKGSWKNLSWSQKLVYSSAIVNVFAVGVVLIRRQFQAAEQEEREQKEYEQTQAELTSGEWGETSQFKCYFAAGLYREMSATATFEDELRQHTPEVQKVLEILDKCKAEIYEQLPAETPAMRKINPSQYVE
mmetsp:Transcript_51147/g.115236  ORF Transcript_51147/g.115236 Transcript_51147/m.115236 type:complete len:137 (+) Transcript_51147:90-500(+)